MTFQECAMTCAGNKELVREFNRLNGSHLGVPRSGIEKAIDDACGYDPYAESLPQFLAFVYECIWLPLMQKTADI